MPFSKGHKYCGRKKGTPNKRTVWLLESLQEHGFDYEACLVNALKHGDFKLAELLVRMVPHIANAPKHDVSIDGVETLVINRYAPDVPKDAQDEPLGA